MAVFNLIGQTRGNGEGAHATAVGNGLDVVALLDGGNQLLEGLVTRLDISCGHANDRLKGAVNGPGVAGEVFAQGRGGLAAVKPSCQNAIFDQIVLSGFCTLIVIGHIAAAGVLAALGNGQNWRTHGLAQLPLLTHGFVREHKVGLGLVAEGLVGKDARRLRRQHHRVLSGHHRHGLPHECRLLPHGGPDLVRQILQFFKPGAAPLPGGGELLLPLCHAAPQGQAAGLIVVCNVRTQRGLEGEYAVPVQINANGHGAGAVLAEQGQIALQKGLLLLYRDTPHRVVLKNKLPVPVSLQLGDDGILFDVGVGRRRVIEPVQSLLNMGHICDGGVVPHLTIVYPQERPNLHRGLEFLQIAVLVLDHRPAAVLDTDIRIEVFPKFNHLVFLLP